MLPQLIPAGLLVTVPLPVPALTIVSVKPEAVCRLKVAVHVLLALIVTEPFGAAAGAGPAGEGGTGRRSGGQGDDGAIAVRPSAGAAAIDSCGAAGNSAAASARLDNNEREPRACL